MSPRTALLLLPTLLLVPQVQAQSQVERDIAFVRSLATRLRFISLAQSEVDRMKQRYKDADDFQNVAQLGIEISLIGAKVHPNREERRTLYQDALERCSEFLTRYDEGAAALSARITLADAALEFGKFLADEVEVARVETPGRVADLEEQAGEVFRAGVEAAERVMTDLEDKISDDINARSDYGLSWLRKGILLREQARAIQKDRGYLTSRSRDTLEELIFEWGEETLLGQRALLEYAQNDEVEGKLESALRSYGDVIDNAQILLDDEEIPLEAKDLIGEIFEEAFDRLAATQFRLGQIEKVVATVDDYRTRMEGFGLPLTDLDAPVADAGRENKRFGHSLYLTYARALAESGESAKVGKSLGLVQFLNEEHPFDIVGQRAKLALKEILAAQSQRVSGELLFQVAKGDYQAKDWEATIRSSKKAIAAMDGEEAGRLGLEAYYMMGQAHAIQERVLEATIALKTGLERHASTAENAIRDRAASLVQRTVRQLRADTREEGDFYEALSDQIADLAAKYGSVADAAKRSYNDAGQYLQDERYDDAVKAYRRVGKESLYHELAYAGIVATHQRQGDHKAAREAIAEYRTFLESKDARIPNDRNDLRQAREIAQARVDFYEGYMLYLEGMGYGDFKADLTKFPEAVTLLSDFDTKHGKAEPNLVPRVHFVLGRSHLEMGELEKAEGQYRTLKANWPTDGNVSVLASSLFAAHDAKVTAKAAEVDSIANQGDKGALAAAKKELEAQRRKTVSIGREYFDESPDPQYGICYLMLEHMQALRDWTAMEQFGNKVIEAFQNDPNESEKADKFVRAMVGDAVLRQRKFRQAYDMLSAAEAARPNNYPLKRLVCLALGGWQEIDDRGQVVRYYGLGKPAEAYEKYWTEYKTYGLNRSRGVTRYSLEWYEFHWEVYHFALKAAENDSEFKNRARTIYSLAKSTDDFANLSGLGARGRELYDLFAENPPPR